MASARPSSALHRSITAGVLASVNAKCRSTPLARSVNSSTAPNRSAWAAGNGPGGTASASSRITRSAAKVSGAWLVTIRCRPGAASSRAWVTREIAANWCSTLSSTTSSCSGATAAHRAASGSPAPGRSPSAAAMVSGRAWGSVMAASSTQHTPCCQAARWLVQKGLRQPRLAQAASAHQRDQPVRLDQHAQGGQVSVAADQGRQLTGQIGALGSVGRCLGQVSGHRRQWRAGGSTAGGRVWRLLGRAGRQGLGAAGETVAPAREGGDQLAAQDLAQCADLGGQVVFFHHRAGPDQVEQRAFGQQLPGPIGQYQQQVKGP